MFAVTKEILDTHEALLSIEVETQVVEDAKRKAARKFAREIRIPGFRPGRAPYKRVLNYVGEAAILQEASEQLLNELYPQAIEKADVKPYGPGEFEDMEQDPLTFKVKVPLEPTITLGDYHNLRHEWEDITVTDEELDEVLEQVREENVVLEPVERPAEMGDEVHIDVLGTSGDEVIIEENDFAVQLDTEDDFFVPGFVEALVGLSEGDEKTFTLTVPEDSEEEDLRGEDVDFEVGVLHIFTRQLPELDDALASTVGAFETLDELKTDMVDRITEYKTEQARSTYRTTLLDMLVEQADIHYPPPMIEETIDDMVNESTERLKQQYKLSLEDALRLEGRTMEQYRDTIRSQAEQRICNSLVLAELAKAEAIEVSDDEVVQGFRDMVMNLGTGEGEAPSEDVFKNMDLNSELGQYIRNSTYHRKVMERLEQIARGEAEVELDEEQDEADETDEADVVEAAGDETEVVAETVDAAEDDSEVPVEDEEA